MHLLNHRPITLTQVLFIKIFREIYTLFANSTGFQIVISGILKAMGPEPPTLSTILSDLSTEVSGKKLGIVGMGGIGYQIAKRAAKGFDMKILYHNRNRR